MSENMGQASRATGAHEAAFVQSIQETQEASKMLDAVLEANKMDASKDKLQSEAEDNSALGQMIKSQKQLKKQVVKPEKARHVEKSVLVRKEDADGLAGEFSQRQGNREYHLDPHALSRLAAEELGEGINPDSNPDEVITIIRNRLSFAGQVPDVSVVDKAFEFLLEVTESHLKTANEADKPRLKGIQEKLVTAKTKHFEAHAVEIQVAQKIIGAVDAVVEKTGQSVKETLDHYRDIVHNPPDLQTLRKFYEAKGFKTMVLELKGLSTYLGGNFKRVNLETPELAQLASAARKMQALLGVYRQSKAHMVTVESVLRRQGIIQEQAA